MAKNLRNNPPSKLAAVRAILGGTVGFSYEKSADTFHFPHGGSLPPQAEIDAKLTELLVAYPIRLLREERNQKLAETDWWASRAVDGITLTQAQKDYRKALRDLPATAEPKLENGLLTNVVWPENPE